MERASTGVSSTRFSKIIFLIASCQPSGVVLTQEIRSMLPCSSAGWQVPHLAFTSGSVTGMPGSSAVSCLAPLSVWAAKTGTSSTHSSTVPDIEVNGETNGDIKPSVLENPM